MSGGKRWWLWLPLLGVAAWLALFGDRPGSGNAVGVSEAVPRRSQPGAANAAPPSRGAPQAKAAAAAEPIEALVDRTLLVSAQRMAPTRDAVAAQDLFSPRSWTPAPAAAPAVVNAPVAPPLPFVYLGRKLEGEAWEVYLGRADQTFIARVGQTLDGGWRVDSVAPPAMVLTYLPLGQAQTLAIGDSR